MSLDTVVNPKLVQATIDCLVKGVVECDRMSGKHDSPVEIEHINAYRCEYNRALRSGSFSDALPDYFKRVTPLIVGNPVGKKANSVFSFAKTWAAGMFALGVLNALFGRFPQSVEMMSVSGIAYFSIDFVQKYFAVKSKRAWNRRCSRVLYADKDIWQEAVAILYNNSDAYESFREKQNA